MAPLNAGILIGGRSTRMGQPKALLTVGGITLLERAVDACRRHVEAIYLLGDGPMPPALAAMPRLPDAPGVRGPLAAMLAAFAARPQAAWLFVACDLPGISEQAVAWLTAQRAAEASAVLPRVAESGVEPLLAIYEPAALPRLRELAGRGCWSPQSLAGPADVLTPRPPAALVRAWMNVNTPADLDVLRQP